ncbi:PREDICTED: piwi-like protein 1 [Polistes dominula]|uniref:Piwi-like protein 1 n=1 Tax=Polistes dominula TaxID=743375 RepID=A0ABM1I8B6_POLDO|nr:PREDICTED: piwi-like protein 1 [Polistes dominula]
MAEENNNDRMKYGIGRSSTLLQKIKQMAKNEPKVSNLFGVSSSTYHQEPVSLSQSQASSTVLPIIRGGKSFPSTLTQIESNVEETSTTLTVGKGRATFSCLRKIAPIGQPLLPEQQTRVPSNKTQQNVIRQPAIIYEQLSASNDDTGVLGKLSQLSVYEAPSSSSSSTLTTDVNQKLQVINRQGTSGTTVNIYSNYIDLKLEPGRGIYQYEVKFNPDIDSIALRRKLVNQHARKLGKALNFDGSLLYLPQKLSEEKIVYNSEHPRDGSLVTLTFIFKKKESINKNIQFLNILFGRILRALNLVRIGRQHFNPSNAHTVPQHKLEIWPGYITAINEHEGGIKLCVDIKHRVLRTETVYDIMKTIYNRNPTRYKDETTCEIIGTNVLTRYNNKSYRIDDIAWDKNPTYKFERKGKMTTIMDYYKNHWNIEIKDKEQPLLINHSTEMAPSGESLEKLTLLVPELCYISGLTDSIRSDYRIMKDLHQITNINPNYRNDIIKKFIQQIKTNDVAREILSPWGLEFDDNLTKFNGRILMPEPIYFGNNKIIQGKPNADWNNESTKNPVLRAPSLTNWTIFYYQKDTPNVTAFIKTVINISSQLGLKINKPREVPLPNDRTETYCRELHKHINNDLEMVVVVFPTNRTDRYSAIKKLCCVEKPIPSQVIMSRTISRPDKLRTITQKIMLQINCKLGGALWAVDIPFDKCMVCGIDVFHPDQGSRNRLSVAGFVASMDKLLTSWLSKICLHRSNQEIVDMLQICFISAIDEYKRRNGNYPNRIIVYRDGVGDGQIQVITNYEVKQLLETFTRIDPNYKPQLSVIVVQKRINTRLFYEEKGNLINPGSGTIIDSFITRANFYDFFLVPQSKNFGTVTPTHYIVAYDGSNMKPDHMQRFTYKLCHLYYNWAGTIKVPAPCQYAHKLAFLVGQNIQMEPDEKLCNKLFYL